MARDPRSTDGRFLRTRRRLRSASALLLACMLALTATDDVSAGRSDSVDPAFMTPTLNPGFDWECWRAGETIVCDGTATETWTAIELFPCADGGTVYSTGFDSRRIRRISDADGRALSSRLAVQIREQVSRSPTMDGIVGRGMGQFSVSFDWPIPGELSSRTSILHGVDLSVVVPGHGLILHQVGVLSYDFQDNLLFARGVHPIADDADAAFEELAERGCDALAGA